MTKTELEPDWKKEAFGRFKTCEDNVLKLKCQGDQPELLHYNQGKAMALAELLIHFGVDLHAEEVKQDDKLHALLREVNKVDTWP